MRIGGREVNSFVELSKYGSKRILAIYPIPDGGGHGFSFAEGDSGSVDIWGINSPRGQRIAEAYEYGLLPTDNRDKLNRVLRGDELACD
jgi:hypothetical protein